MSDRERVEVLAKVLFDSAFPGERESDPYWFQAYEMDWLDNARAILASDFMCDLLAEAKADAWDEGVRSGRLSMCGPDWPKPANPYRETTTGGRDE